jgi:hypothetical protein
MIRILVPKNDEILGEKCVDFGGKVMFFKLLNTRATRKNSKIRQVMVYGIRI